MPEPQRDRGDRRAVDEVYRGVGIKAQAIVSAKLRLTHHTKIDTLVDIFIFIPQGEGIKYQCH